MIRVLLADDQILLLGALATLLSLESDIEVVGQAVNGRDALGQVRTLTPDVLLTDIEMPELTGLEVAAQIKAEGLATRVLVVTTFGRAGYLRRALDAGVSGYILKDGPVDALAETVRRVHARQKVISPQLAALAWDAQDDPLNDRERTVLRMAEDGWPNKKIAEALNLSSGTVRNYLSEAVSKVGASNRIEAGRIARDRGWL